MSKRTREGAPMESWRRLRDAYSLWTDEIEIAKALGLAVYFDGEKEPSWMDVEAILTSHRLLIHGKYGTFEVSLVDIRRLEGKSGFIGSSSKIQLEILSNEVLVERRSAIPAWQCPACEESNKGGAEKCMVCGTRNSSLHVASAVVKPAVGSIKTTILSFRSGGQSKFLEQLATAIKSRRSTLNASAAATREAAALQSTIVGVAGLMRKAEADLAKQQSNQDQAFSDLDALMRQAQEMGKLAETISARLQTDGLSAKEDQEFRSLLGDLGFTSTAITVSGSKYI